MDLLFALMCDTNLKIDKDKERRAPNDLNKTKRWR
ncbi:MAG: hypothetical protein ACI8RD_001203, partial [Bacillariaceae sp.]